MNKVKQYLILFWLLSTTVIAVIIWCIIYFMPNDSWLYWFSIFSVVILSILCVGLGILEWIFYEMLKGIKEMHQDIKPLFNKFMADPLGCIFKGSID